MPDPLWTQPVAPARRSTPAAGRRQFAVAAVAAGVLGVLAGVATWVRPVPAPYYVPLWVTQYSSPVLPPDPAAEADREAVRAAGFFTRGPDTYASQEAALLLRELRELANLPPTERAVVYVCGYAVPTAGGEVAFYPADADPTHDPNTIPLSTILRLAAACPARSKLLVLDLIEPVGDVRAGAVRADVSARIPALLAKADPGNGLLVLCPCGPGQVSHAMPAASRTAFGFYFEQGLRGAARAYHDPDHGNDDRVSAKELARYLQERVDRWAWENLGVRQTPQLYGGGPDFDLVAAGRGVIDPPPADAAPDPPWLADGWAELEKWRTDGTLSESPRLFQRLQSAVRRANLRGRGPTADRAATELAFARQRIAEDLQLARASVPRPANPASLALAETYGQKPDPALRQAAAKLLADVRAVPAGKPDAVQAAVTKLVDTFAKSPASAFAFEDAVFAAAVDAAEGRPDLLQPLDQALAARGQPPAYSEARFLRRIAAQSKALPADQWVPDLARLALRAVRSAEQATARPDLYPWAGGAMDACAEARLEGELLFAARPNVAADDVAVRFRRAAALANTLIAFGDAVRDARRTADLSLIGLGPAAGLLGAFPDRGPLWRERLAATADLLPLLDPPATPPGEAELLPRGDELRRRTDRVRRATDALHGGSPDAVTEYLIGRAAREDAGPDVLGRLTAVLSLPGLPVSDRTKLGAARLALAKKLDAATRRKDAADDARGTAPAAGVLTATESADDRAAAARHADRRAQEAVALLRLAGIPAATADHLDKLRTAAEAGGPDAAAWDDLAAALRRGWGHDLRTAAAALPPARLDTLAALAPGDEPITRFDDPVGGPRVTARRAAATAYLGWLGDRYRAEARAGLDPPSAEAALADLGPVAGPGLGAMIELSGPAGPVVLPPAKPLGEALLAVTRSAAERDPPQVRVLLPDGSPLVVTPSLTDLPADPAAPNLLRSTLRLAVETSGFGPPPTGSTGFVVECRLRDRSVFAALAVTFGAPAPPVELVLSPVAAPPADLGDAVRLRPSEAAQPFFLFVRNKATDPRAASVQATGALSGDAKVTAAAGATVPVNLAPGTVSAAPPAAPAPPAGVDLPAAVRLQLVGDDKAAAVLVDRTVRFDVADPLEYLAVTDASFQPANPPAQPVNRLRFTLKARRSLGTTPCTAELVLDAASIPGFGGVKLARLKGQVPADGTPLTLEAEGLALDPAADEDGAVSLTLDGVVDAVRFRVSFARFGPPTMPALDLSPRVRLALDPPPTPGQSVRFHTAADRAPLGSTLEARLLRSDPGGRTVTEREQKFPAPRQARAAFAPAAGGFTVAPTVKDWDVTWDTPLSIGKRTLQVRLQSATGTVLAVAEKPLTLDTSPPVGVAIVGLPAKAKKGDPLTVKATGSDPESGIDSVKFFLGKPANNQPPPGAAVVAGVPDADNPGTWQAQLPTGDKSGPTDVGVVFENGAGLVASDAKSVDLVAELPVQPGGITGTVLEGDRPQAGLVVSLADAKGTAVKTATTAADGSFAFPGLPPGKYTLSVSKSASSRSAKQAVTVEAGKTATATLALLL